mmetsp:Transcript_15034/g.22804  ORF Transcript_15034/g.22804 Transcript_15034/m.22804 type:complete len:121 (-) Transcript_15034:360-722(-)|eukprot:CAMPEP_0196134206 /NCGR_PEP_ID=MMETSP0910-20130528/3164_1 /TAXON_ID=49265 /ORGANISM="Thalassiosira rotula, Strain GSO102" /LENGTH=120 /DNA_ID=CAMNT_0041394061 /DNA_START=91 /DNA_END=453 /DNA_ORIENTATION=+
MKSIISLVAVALSLPSAVAFVPQAAAPSMRTKPLMAKLDMTPEIEAAIAEVRDAASTFGDETAHFANVWIDRAIDGNKEGTAAGLLEECILDDDEGKCARFSDALAKLDGLLGVGAGEQY